MYDVLNGWVASDDFYLALVMAAPSVLDVGCGTGTLLRRARETGHTGRLVGVDPDEPSLKRARERADVDWLSGTAAEMTFTGEFDLATMTGNAFQCLVTDDDVRDSLAAIRRALADGGRFAFETRNPVARAWENWHPGNAANVVDHAGRAVRVWHHVEAVVDSVVTITETTGDQDGDVWRVDRADLRFLDVDTLDKFLADAGFVVESRYGGWQGQPFESDSREIITVARAPRSVGGRG